MRTSRQLYTEFYSALRDAFREDDEYQTAVIADLYDGTAGNLLERMLLECAFVSLMNASKSVTPPSRKFFLRRLNIQAKRDRLERGETPLNYDPDEDIPF